MLLLWCGAQVLDAVELCEYTVHPDDWPVGVASELQLSRPLK